MAPHTHLDSRPENMSRGRPSLAKKSTKALPAWFSSHYITPTCRYIKPCTHSSIFFLTFGCFKQGAQRKIWRTTFFFFNFIYLLTIIMSLFFFSLFLEFRKGRNELVCSWSRAWKEFCYWHYSVRG